MLTLGLTLGGLLLGLPRSAAASPHLINKSGVAGIPRDGQAAEPEKPETPENPCGADSVANSLRGDQGCKRCQAGMVPRLLPDGYWRCEHQGVPRAASAHAHLENKNDAGRLVRDGQPAESEKSAQPANPCGKDSVPARAQVRGGQKQCSRCPEHEVPTLFPEGDWRCARWNNPESAPADSYLENKDGAGRLVRDGPAEKSGK